MSIPKVVTTDRIPSRAIDPDALKVIRRLRRYGHEAYLVGGCVRDLLLGHEPKDFDVITSARPRQVRRLFGNSRVIGRRFRLVHVIFGDNVVEVSTFRADPSQFTETPATTTDEPESRDAEDEADIESDVSGTGATSDVEEADDDVDDEVDDEPEGEAPAATLAEIGALVQAVHDPLDPDDPGPAVELEPDDDAALAAPAEAEDEDDDEAPEPATERNRRRAQDEDDPDRDDADRDDDREDDDRRGRRRGRGARDEDIDANNMFGDAEQDAKRRDFTINALFYDPDRAEIIDYTGGLEDLERKLVNPINDPEVAFVEDPVRMIRAVRFAAKLEFEIEARAKTAIDNHRGLLADCSQRRLLEEVLKILKGGYASRCAELLLSTAMMDQFLPDIAEWIAEVPPVPPKAAAPAVETAAPSSEEQATGAAPEAQSDEVAALAGAPPPADASRSPSSSESDDVSTSDATSTSTSDLRSESQPVATAEPHPVEDAEPEQPAAAAAAAGAQPAARVATWGPARPIGNTGVTLYPRDSWRPDQRMVDAFLRVTWDRPPLEGANDWVEDPHVYLADGIFEAAAFARDVVLEETGRADLAALPAERARAAAVLKVLRWNERLEQMVASFSAEEPKGGGSRGGGRRRRGRRDGRDRDRDRDRPRPRRDEGREVAARAPEADPTPTGPSAMAELCAMDRRTLLLGYLEGLDRLNHRGVPLPPAVQLAVLFAPMLLTRLDEAVRRRGPTRQPSSEELADELLFPIARRHSLARRDRDRVKRIVLSLRRMLTGELRRRARQGGRMGKIVSRDYFREAIVVLWLHCRATSSGWDEFRFWEGRAKPGRGGR